MVGMDKAQPIRLHQFYKFDGGRAKTAPNPNNMVPSVVAVSVGYLMNAEGFLNLLISNSMCQRVGSIKLPLIIFDGGIMAQG